MWPKISDDKQAWQKQYLLYLNNHLFIQKQKQIPDIKNYYQFDSFFLLVNPHDVCRKKEHEEIILQVKVNTTAKNAESSKKRQ